MSVKKADRHISKSEPLEKSRWLMQQLMTITRPAIEMDDGKIIKPGILGQGQPFWAFGRDLFNCGKQIHAQCYQANEIYLKDKETLNTRSAYLKKALEYCNSILRQIDLCIFQYARNNKKKRRSFEYLARLTKDAKISIQERLNRDKLILQHKAEHKRTRRYR